MSDFDKRDNAAFEANGPIRIGALEFRPFSIMTLQCARKLDLSMIMGSGAELDQEELVRQVTIYAWMQASPIRDVSRAIREGTWEEEVDVFAAALDVPTIIALMREVERHVEQIGDHAFDLMPRDEKSSEDPPPNC